MGGGPTAATSILLGLAIGVSAQALTPECTAADATVEFLRCGVCQTAPLLVALQQVSPSNASLLCGGDSVTAARVYDWSVDAIVGAAEFQGDFFLGGGVEINATTCLRHLVANMPRRDLLLLFTNTLPFVDFLVETVREAVRVWPTALKYGASWATFLDTVLPYAVLDEKRDLGWHGRRRLRIAFIGYPGRTNVSNTTLPPPLATAPNATAAMHTLVRLLPFLMIDGHSTFATPQADVVVSGNTVNWKSESSPAMLSPEQVVEYGGASCTGTAVILVAAARAVGIPARIAGCSQSIVPGDDHHWVEFFDSSDAGPLGDFWHTKEGVSRGNEGGPWDSLSGPMSGCMRGVTPRDTLNTIWAASWSSTTYLPLQWSNTKTAATWSFLGGVNRCGAYCTAFGCGANQSSHWTDAECAPRG